MDPWKAPVQVVVALVAATGIDNPKRLFSLVFLVGAIVTGVYRKYGDYLDDAYERHPIATLLLAFLTDNGTIVFVIFSIVFSIGFVNDKFRNSLARKKTLPPLETTQSLGGSTAIPSTGVLRKHKRAVAARRLFGIDKSIRFNRYVEATAIWKRFEDLGSQGFSWGNEAEIASLLELVVRDLVKILGVPYLSVRLEVQFSGLRPDKWLVYRKDIPIGVIEVKLPTFRQEEDASMNNEHVHGQVFDYLTMLKAYYGVQQPFCILTTYRQWQVYWLDGMDDIATQEKTENKVPQRSRRCIGHTWDEILGHVNQEFNQEEIQEEGEGERNLYCSRIVSHNDTDILVFLGTIIRKMLCTEVEELEFDDLTKAVIKCHNDTWQWVSLRSTGRFTWRPTVRANCTIFYLLKQLGGGTDGRVWLACTKKREICAIKMQYGLGKASVCPEELSEYERNEKESEDKELYEGLLNERECWREAQPEAGQSVRITCILGDKPNALVMPYFAQVPPGRNLTDEEIGAAKNAVRSFAENGWKHNDLKWDHVGFYNRNVPGRGLQIRAVLLDLGFVEILEEGEKEAAIQDMLRALDLD